MNEEVNDQEKKETSSKSPTMSLRARVVVPANKNNSSGTSLSTQVPGLRSTQRIFL
jgi:hypothetical protein